jgi:hypothetical protein
MVTTPMKSSIVIFKGVFDTIGDADEAFRSILVDTPGTEWQRVWPYFEIEDGQVRLTVRQKSDRYSTSLIIRKCNACKTRIRFRDFRDRNKRLSKMKIDKIWTDPAVDILCNKCLERKVDETIDDCIKRNV